MAFWSSLWWWLRFPLALFAVLVGVMIASVAWMLSGNRYQTFLTEQLSTLLQAQVRVADSQLSIFHGFGIALREVEVRRDATDEATLTAERLVVHLDARALFHGQLLFSYVECVKPTIHLTERTRSFLEVVDTLLSSSEEPVSAQPGSSGWFTPSLSLHQFIITDGEIVYHQGEGGLPFSVTDANLQFVYAPGSGVTAEIEAALGKTGELGVVTIQASAPSW